MHKNLPRDVPFAAILVREQISFLWGFYNVCVCDVYVCVLCVHEVCVCVSYLSLALSLSLSLSLSRSLSMLCVFGLCMCLYILRLYLDVEYVYG